MSKAIFISRLYECVIHNEMDRCGVCKEDVIKGIIHMNNVYKPNPLSLASDNPNIADFRTTGFRCAYLHKYASLHTMLVSDIFNRVIQKNYNYFRHLISTCRFLRVCSLGGGPGTDVIGMLLTLRFLFGEFMISSIVIDCMPYWNITFDSLMREVHSGFHEALSYYLKLEYFRWNYVGANLLKEFSFEVKEAIMHADIINMVKFVSAAICADTEEMIKRIFRLMKPGAIVFFIDNSIGDIKFLMKRAALEYHLKPLYGPVDFEPYSNSLIYNHKFGYDSCIQTNVAIQVWLKSFNN